MFEQDYIVRIIKEMVRALLKMLFHIDAQTPAAELLENEEEMEKLEKLLDMADAGQICEAENLLYEMNFPAVTALLFYSYLNDKTDDFLEEHDFSRKEVREGVERVAAALGMSGVAELFTEGE